MHLPLHQENFHELLLEVFRNYYKQALSFHLAKQLYVKLEKDFPVLDNSYHSLIQMQPWQITGCRPKALKLTKLFWSDFHLFHGEEFGKCSTIVSYQPCLYFRILINIRCLFHADHLEFLIAQNVPKEVTHNRTTDYIIHSARILSNY